MASTEPSSRKAHQRFSRSFAASLAGIGSLEFAAQSSHRTRRAAEQRYMQTEQRRKEGQERKGKLFTRKFNEHKGRARRAALGRWEIGILLERQQIHILQNIIATRDEITEEKGGKVTEVGLKQAIAL